MTSLGINLEVAAEWNRRTILNILRSTDEIERRELAQMTGLSAPTVANIANLLIEEGLVRDAGRTRGGRGQPRVKIELVKDGAFCVGAEIARGRMLVAVLNLAGEVVARCEADAPEISKEGIQRALDEVLASVALDVGMSVERVVGVALCPSRGVDEELGTSSRQAVSGTLLRSRRGQPSCARDIHFVERTSALAMVEPLCRRDHSAERFAYLHLGDVASFVEAVGGGTEHLHVKLVEMSLGRALGNGLAARALGFQESCAVFDKGILRDGGDNRSVDQDYHDAITEGAGRLLLALREAYGRSEPTLVYVGGRFSKQVATDVAAALGRLRGPEGIVLPATEPNFAVALGAAASLLESRLLPRSALLQL